MSYYDGLVKAAYWNKGNYTPDAQGLQYWTNQLNTGALTDQTFGNAFNQSYNQVMANRAGTQTGTTGTTGTTTGTTGTVANNTVNNTGTTTPSWLTGMNQDRNAGYYKPETGEWVSTSTGGYVDPNNPDMQYGLWNISGMSPELYRLMGLDPNETYYTAGNGGISGTGKAGDQYSIFDSKGVDTGKKGTYSTTTESDMWKEFATYAALLAGGAVAGGALGGVAGAGTPGVVGANGAFLGEGVASGIGAWDGALAAAGGATGTAGGVGGLDFSQGFTDGGTAGGALDTGYASGSLGGTNGVIDTLGNTANNTVGPDFTTGYTDNGTAGGAADTEYASGSAGGTNGGSTVGGGDAGTGTGTGTGTGNGTGGTGTGGTGTGTGTGNGNGTGGGLTLRDILGAVGGLWDYNNQNKASEDMLNYLKERQALNDNMYAPGSTEYNALWDEMSRKDAAAGRNSQYGPRSVDLAARIAQLKMDANTRMTTGIAERYESALDRGAGSNAGVLSSLGALLGGAGSNSGLNFSIGDITNWIGDLFGD